jgi:hypothetical protein
MSLLRNPGEAIRTVVSTVTFATGATARSASEVRTIAPASTRQDGGGPIAVVVLDGASADVATTLNDELGAGYLAIADGDGRIAESFGVRRWPTTIPVGDTRPPVEPTVERTDT